MVSIVAAALSILLATASASANTDEIKNLPGVRDQINFRQYSGFLSVENGKHLHYWFVESQQSPSTDPVLLWMNGGPGCSSLDGLLTELGPFQVDNGGETLSLNKFSWNQFANVLFLEAPAGVGFSYSESDNYTTDDDTTAADNYNALKDFFSKFPRFKTNDFYISGESYGGTYVPTLSVLVLNGDEEINFKGFAIGNGCLDEAKLNISAIFFAYYHGLFDTDQWNDLVRFCCKGNASRESCNFSNSDDALCKSIVHKVRENMDVLFINPYNIYSNCQSSRSEGYARHILRKKNERKEFRSTETIPVRNTSCLDSHPQTAYLNRIDVRSALHIPEKVQQWVSCSDEFVVGSSYEKVYTTMQPQVMELLCSGKLRGLIYNGDVDSVCDFLGDEWFVEDLGLDIVEKFKPWMFESQIAGFVKNYKNLSFVIVKGSGHMVPADKPGPALKMIRNFLLNEPL